MRQTFWGHGPLGSAGGCHYRFMLPCLMSSYVYATVSINDLKGRGVKWLHFAIQV